MIRNSFFLPRLFRPMIHHFLNENVDNSGQAHLIPFVVAKQKREKILLKIENNFLVGYLRHFAVSDDFIYEGFQIKFITPFAMTFTKVLGFMTYSLNFFFWIDVIALY